MTEEANEQAQQAEASPNKVPPPPKFDPDPALVEESQRTDTKREGVAYRRKDLDE